MDATRFRVLAIIVMHVLEFTEEPSATSIDSGTDPRDGPAA